MESGKEMKNQRMLDELTELMRIDVSSGQETEIAEHLVKKLEERLLFRQKSTQTQLLIWLLEEAETRRYSREI